MQFLVLRLIHEEPMHGYRIIEELETRGYVEASRLRSGSIYIILKRMEHTGWLRSIKIDPSEHRSPRVYSLTQQGHKELEEGLKFILERRKINDELINYYRENFEEGSN
jgi:DNA-binding PadR family transcriptional regulator